MERTLAFSEIGKIFLQILVMHKPSFHLDFVNMYYPPGYW